MILDLDYRGSGGELEKQATVGGKTIVTYPDGGLQVSFLQDLSSSRIIFPTRQARTRIHGRRRAFELVLLVDYLGDEDLLP